MERNTIQILITGDPTKLAPRLPTSAGPFDLKWDPVPVLRYEAIPLSEKLEGELSQSDFNWVLFPSANAVRFFSEALIALGLELPAETQVACIGKQTADTANQDGFTCDFYPEAPGTLSFLSEFKDILGSGRKILIPCAKEGRKTLAQSLREDHNADVVEAPLYRTVARDVRPTLTSSVETADLIIFTSPSSVDAFSARFPIPSKTPVVCLGEYTASYLQSKGISAKILRNADYRNIGELLC